MKKFWLLFIALVLMTSVAWADTFNVEAPLKYTQQKQGDGSYLITLSGNLCIPDGVLYVYHQDNLRGRNIRKYRAEPVTFTNDLKQWVVNSFTIEVGQVMYNLYSPKLNRWMGIPSCLVLLGDGLAYGNSYFSSEVQHEGDWDIPGGVGIVITATGIPVQYPVAINCDQGKPAPAPVVSMKPAPPVRVSAPAKRAPAPKPCPPERASAVAKEGSVALAQVKSPSAVQAGQDNAAAPGTQVIKSRGGIAIGINKSKNKTIQVKAGHTANNNKGFNYQGSIKQFVTVGDSQSGVGGADYRYQCHVCHNQADQYEEKMSKAAWELLSSAKNDPKLRKQLLNQHDGKDPFSKLKK